MLSGCQLERGWVGHLKGNVLPGKWVSPVTVGVGAGPGGYLERGCWGGVEVQHVPRGGGARGVGTNRNAGL